MILYIHNRHPENLTAWDEEIAKAFAKWPDSRPLKFSLGHRFASVSVTIEARNQAMFTDGEWRPVVSGQVIGSNRLVLVTFEATIGGYGLPIPPPAIKDQDGWPARLNGAN